jgi:hypothetical protein
MNKYKLTNLTPLTKFNGFRINRRNFLTALVGHASDTIFSIESIDSVITIADINFDQDELSVLEKEARRLMSIASEAKESGVVNFTFDQVIALAFEAGFDFGIFQQDQGLAFLPLNSLCVERKKDKSVIVRDEVSKDRDVM